MTRVLLGDGPCDALVGSVEGKLLCHCTGNGRAHVPFTTATCHLPLPLGLAYRNTKCCRVFVIKSNEKQDHRMADSLIAAVSVCPPPFTFTSRIVRAKALRINVGVASSTQALGLVRTPRDPIEDVFEQGDLFLCMRIRCMCIFTHIFSHRHADAEQADSLQGDAHVHAR